MPNDAMVQCPTTAADDTNEAHSTYAYKRLVRDMPYADRTEVNDPHPLGTNEQTHEVVP